jgi:hypothetical protein
MESDWKNLSIPFVGGLDTKTDPKLVSPTRLTHLENGVFTKHGSLRKRPGNDITSPLALGNTTIENPLGIATRSNELLLQADSRLYSYNGPADRWQDAGAQQMVSVRQTTLANVNAAQLFVDVCTNGGVTVAVWQDSRGGVRMSAFTADTGAPLLTDYSLDASGQAPSAVAVAGSILLFWYNTSTDDIKGLRILPAALATSAAVAATTVCSDAGATGKWDVVGSDEAAYLAYFADASVDSYTVRLFAVAPDLTALATAGLSTDADIQAVAVGLSDSYVHAAFTWEDATDRITEIHTFQPLTLGAVDDDDVNTTTDDVNALALVGQPGTDEVVVYIEHNNASTYHCSVVWTSRNPVTATNGNVTGTLLHSQLGSRAWGQGDRSHVVVLHQSVLQSTYFLLRDDGHIYGRLNEGLASAPHTEPRLPSVQLTDDQYVLALRCKRRLVLDSTSTAAAVLRYTHDNFQRTVLDYADPVAFQAVQAGGATYSTGAILWQYDGDNPVEAGFFLYPENISSALDTGGTPAIPNGTYNYRVYYEWTNDAGERERSSAVAFQVVNAAGSRRVVLTIPTLAHTLKRTTRSAVAVVVYRTATLGTLYYRASSPDPTTAGTENGWVNNDPTANTVTFTDNLTDATLILREGDYQNAGEFDNIAPPACSVLASSATRLFLAGGTIPDNTVIYSKQRSLGQPAGEFNGNLTIRVPDDGGRVTALAEVEGALVVFKRDRMYAVPGDGPNDVGGGQFYGTARLVSSDVGCLRPRTVVLTPAGLLFVSERGIYSFDGNAVKYIGAPVERYNVQSFVAATVLPAQSLVVFTATNGPALAYDYLFGEWSVWTGYEAIDAVRWDDRMVALRDTGHVMRQHDLDDRTCTDGGTFYSLYGRTGPVRPQDAGVQEYWRLQRAQILGEYISSHLFEFGLIYDRETDPFETIVWDPSTVVNTTTWGDVAFTWGDSTTVWGGAGDSDYHFELRVARQKCSTVRFEFRDLPGDSVGASYELTELALRWKPKTGLGRVPATRKV